MACDHPACRELSAVTKSRADTYLIAAGEARSRAQSATTTPHVWVALNQMADLFDERAATSEAVADVCIGHPVEAMS